MKCVLHIGTEKTGTTLIQDWLYDNRDELSRQGVYLSDILGKSNNRLFAAYFQASLDEWARSVNIRTLAEKDHYFRGFPERLAREIRQASEHHDVFLITSEHLHSRVTNIEDISAIREFTSQCFEDTQVICYFRTQADMALSLYSTGLKAGVQDDLDRQLDEKATPENYYYNFKQIADNWSSLFGRDKCSFRLYDRKRFLNNDIRDDFIKLIPCQIDTSRLDYSRISSNESIGRLAARAVLQLNRHVSVWKADGGGRNPVRESILSELIRAKSLNSGKLDTSFRNEVSARFKAANADFLRTYFPGVQSMTASAPVESEGHAVFTFADVESVIDTLMSAVLPHIKKESETSIRDADADALRNLALRIERGEKLGLNEAHALMSMAHRIRPGGAFIRQKMENYAKRLRRNE